MLQRVCLATICIVLLNGLSRPVFSKQEVQFVARHQPLGDVLSTIQQQTGIRLVYVNAVVDSFKVFRKFNDSPYDAVRKALLGTPLDFIRKTDDLWVIVPRSQTRKLPSTITGMVTDLYLQQPVAGANVYIEGTKHGVATDIQGRFVLDGVAPGRISIRVRRIGYHEIELHLRVLGNARKEIEIALEPRPVTGEEVIVEDTIIPRENEAVLNRQTITKSQMETPPIANDGEVFELLHQQPGVTRRDMDDVFPHIEGGSATEVVVELDGMPIYVPTFGQNRRSVFAASIVQDLTLHRSGFGIEYGDAMSGIVSLRTPDIRNIDHTIYTSASLTGLAFNYKKNTEKVGVTGVWRNGRFANNLRFDQWQGFDLFNKVAYRPAENHKITLLALVSRGSFVESNSLESEQLLSQNLGLKYEHQPFETDSFSALVYTSKLNEQMRETGFRLKYMSKLNDTFTAIAGLDFTELESFGTITLDSLGTYKVARDIVLPSDGSGNFYVPIETDPSDLFKQRATILSPYIGVTLSRPLWQLTAGARLPADVHSSALRVEPRTQLAITPSDKVNLTFSKGRYLQFTDRSYASEAKSGDKPGLGEFLVKTDSRQPSVADHFRAEATWLLSPSMTASLAYFDKNYEFHDRAYLSRINRWFWMLPIAGGQSRGYEFWLGKTAGKFQGWLSYTLNNQVYESENGTFFRPYFNRDKVFNLSMQYYLSAELQLKAQYVRATGYPARDWSPDRVVISPENTPEVFARRFLTEDIRFGSTRQYAVGLTWDFAAFTKESKLNLVLIQRHEQDVLGFESGLKFWASLIFAN